MQTFHGLRSQELLRDERRSGHVNMHRFVDRGPRDGLVLWRTWAEGLCSQFLGFPRGAGHSCFRSFLSTAIIKDFQIPERSLFPCELLLPLLFRNDKVFS